MFKEFILGIGALCIFTLCMLFIAGCESEITEEVMVEGNLLSTKVEEGELLFSFTTEKGTVYNNFEGDLNYEIVINNDLNEPKLTYEKEYIVTLDSDGEEIDRQPKKEIKIITNLSLSGGTKILISMSEDTYKELYNN